MKNEEKTNEEAIRELARLRQDIVGSRVSEAGRRETEEALGKSEEEARRLAREHAIMAEIGRIINSTLRIEEVYERFAEEVRKVIPFDRLTINLNIPEEDKVSIPYVTGVEVEGRRVGDFIPFTGSLNEHFVRTRSPLLIQVEDERECSRRFPVLLPTFRAGLRSMMAAPLISKDEVIGGLHFRSTKPKVYTDHDLKLAESIASQIAGAIANARLYAERLRAEEALRESEEKYRLVTENANEAILVAQDARIKFSNSKTKEISGYSSEELASMPFPEFIHPEDRQKVVENFLKRLQGINLPHIYPFRILSKDGKIKWVEINATLITWEGKPATLNFLSDITERKQAEESLRISEERYRLLVENANEGIMVFQDGMLKFINPEMLELTGYSREELTSMSFVEMIQQEDQHTVMEEHYRRLRGEKLPQIYEFRFVDKKGNVRWAEGNVIAVTWEGKPATLSFLSDITERKRAEETIRKMAYHDSLTGLPNRLLFNDRLTQALAHAFRNQEKLAMMFLDLDRFKDTNDSLGHYMGDQLLRAVANRLVGLLRKSDTVARMGGDEFMLLLPGITQMEDAAEVALKILRAFQAPFLVEGHEIHITASIGVALFPYDGGDPDTLIKNADTAMYRAKELGRNNYQCCSPVKKEKTLES